MRVALDARTVFAPTRRGTGKNLVDLYTRLAQLRPDWMFIMFHRQEIVRDNPFSALANVEPQHVEIRGDRWDLWEQFRLPLAAAASGASVLHSPANTAPGWTRVPLVTTIHDLIPVDLVENDAFTRKWVRVVGRGARRARRIITPSRYTKDRLINFFRLPAEKIVVNGWAPDTACRLVEDVSILDAVRTRYGIPLRKPYIFGFGAVDPRKNTQRIIDAWAGLDPGIRANLHLVLVGIDEPALTRLRSHAGQLAPEGGYALLPFADEADIPALLTGATALCYPSLSEGFGLPILDAFVCNTPVITSNTTSLPEVAGDAARLVDPTSVAEIRHAIADIATQPELGETLRERGRVRLDHYSWERCAKTAATVLAEAA
jgi:glycosyltransferase involved in cell wall biosynthesis